MIAAIGWVMNPSTAASLLGRLNRGKPKRLSRQEIARRTRRLLAGARAYRAKLKAAKAKKSHQKKTRR